MFKSSLYSLQVFAASAVEPMTPLMNRKAINAQLPATVKTEALGMLGNSSINGRIKLVPGGASLLRQPTPCPAPFHHRSYRGPLLVLSPQALWREPCMPRRCSWTGSEGPAEIRPCPLHRSEVHSWFHPLLRWREARPSR